MDAQGVIVHMKIPITYFSKVFLNVEKSPSYESWVYLSTKITHTNAESITK